MIKRRDLVSLFRRVDEVVITKNSTTRRGYSTRTLITRQLLGGCWFASACSDCSDTARLNAELESLVKVADLESCTVPESFEVEFYAGKLVLGSRVEDPIDASSILGLLKEYRMPNYEYTIVTRKTTVLKSIRADDLAEAFEEKNLIEVRVSLKHREKTAKAITVSRVVPQGFDKGVESIIEELLKIARSRAKAMSAAKRPGLTEVGKAEVVLYREASPAFFHEISHILAGARVREILSKKMFDVSNVRICDSPGDPQKPTARFFDDEGVTTRRRWLVEGYSAIDAHHNIKTAYEAGSYPGSAHGLSGKTITMHTSLVVGGGDWKDDELFEETKRGFVVDGIASAMLEDDCVRLVPQTAFRLERGDVGEPVHIRAVKIPITRPIKVLGVGRTGYTKFSRELGGIIVSETSPPIKVEAFIEV